MLFFFYFLKMSLADYRNSEFKMERNIFAGFILFQVAILIDGIFSGLLMYPSIIFLFLGYAYIYSYKFLGRSDVKEKV